ncbi:MAG: 5'-nucleotidase C-terminal domain-containing protein [Pseudomonadota bacterium]
MMNRTLLGAAMVVLLPWSAGAETLTILHVNDVHSRIEPITKYNNTCDPEDDAAGECFGGAARLMSAIAAEKATADGPVLVLDGGDQFQGSLFYTHYKGEAAADVMNAIGFDAMAVGNHEFDDGPEVLREFVDRVNFPVLMANATIAPGSVLDGAVPASVVLEVEGERYGIIGVTPQGNATLAAPGPDLTFSDPVPAVTAEIAALEADGVNRIILLSHSGLNVDERIAANVDGIDLIIGGHSHTLLSNEIEGAAAAYPVMVRSPGGSPTPIVQAGAYTKYLGRIDLTFDDNGVVTGLDGDTMLIDASVPKDAQMDELVVALAEPLDSIREEVVGEAIEALDGSRENCRSRECVMGSLVADAMLDYAADEGYQIAIQNGGGVRASIDAGPITMGDVLTVLPFQNTIATFKFTGQGIVDALEHGVSGVEDGSGRFPQLAGLRMVVDLSVPAGEGRVQRVEVKLGDGWSPIDPAATYGVVTNNFMRQGGDGYSGFAEFGVDAYDYGPGLERVFADYLGKIGPVTPKVHGRVTVE